MAVAYATVANGGKVLRPRLGLRIEDSERARAAGARGAHARAGSRSTPAYRQAILDGLLGAANARAAPRPRCSRASRSRSPARPARRRRAWAGADQSWYVALAPVPEPQVRGRRDRRGRRLRRRHGRADGAPDHRRAASTSTRHTAGGRRSGARLMKRLGLARPVARLPRRGASRVLRIDPLMLLADARPGRREHLHGRHGDPGRHPGQPELLRRTPGGLRGRRPRAHAPALPLRLLAPARVEARDLRLPDRARSCWSTPWGSPRAARGGRSSSRSSTSRRRSSASCCSSLTLAAFMVDRMRRLTERETTSRDRAAGAGPGDARDRPAGPRLGARLPGDRCSTVLFVAGTPWTHFAGLGALAVGGDRDRARRGAGGRRRGPQAVPDGPPHGLPQPDVRSAEEGYQINQSLTAIGPGGRPAAATTRRRRSSTSCPSTTPTSCSAWSARSSVSSGRRSCCPCSPC